MDPWGLDAYSDNVTRGTGSADIAWSYVTAAKISSPTQAALAGVGILADKANVITSYTEDSSGKAIIGVALSAVGTGAAIGATTFVGSALSGYGLGTSINGLPIYGSDKTIGEWWEDFIWDHFGDSCL